MGKDILQFFNLRSNANSASFNNLNIGPNLSLYMNRESIKKFCDEFNNLTSIYNNNVLIYIKLFLYTDKSFCFLIKGPLFSLVLKVILCSHILDNKLVYQITLKNLYYINYLRNFYWFKFYDDLNQYWFKLRLRNTFYSLSNLRIKNEKNNIIFF